MRLLRALGLWVVLSCSFLSIAADADSTTRRIEAVLDKWSSRSAARQALFQIGPEAQSALSVIARASDQSFIRRSRAISLLGTIGNAESMKALGDISRAGSSTHRCLAMHALAEIGTEEALAFLIERLDDSSVCMREVSTDPGDEADVLVCEEAIRLLGNITGLSFAADSKDEQTKLWKAWWAGRR